MKHPQDNLAAASVQQAQAAAKQIAQLYAMIAAKDKRIAELETKLDRANEIIARLHVAIEKADMKNDMKGYVQ